MRAPAAPAYLLDVHTTRDVETPTGPRQRNRVALCLYALARDGRGHVQKIGLADRMVPPAYAHELHAVLRAGLDRVGGTLAVTGDVLPSA